MFEYRFEWDPAKASNNRRKHRITFETAATVLDDPLAVSIPDDEHSGDEQRWVTLGCAYNGALLVIAHTYHETDANSACVRIISARRATSRERRQYESQDEG